MSGLSWNEAAELTRKLKNKDGERKTFGEWCAIVATSALIIVFLILPLAAYFIWANAFVIQHLWAWIVVTTFGMNALTMSQAWGLAIIVAYLTHVTPSWKAEDERSISQKAQEFAMLVLKPWITLFGGWVCAHYFMRVI